MKLIHLAQDSVQWQGFVVMAADILRCEMVLTLSVGMAVYLYVLLSRTECHILYRVMTDLHYVLGCGT
jgi:hypothetical protein